MTAGETPGGGAAASAIELLGGMPGIDSEAIRQALLLTAGLDAALVEKIPTAGSVLEFCTGAVAACLSYRGPAGRRPPLEALLEASSAFGDAGYGARVREFVGAYRRELSSPRGRWRTFLQRLGLTEDSVPAGVALVREDDVSRPDDDVTVPDGDATEEVLFRAHAVILLGGPRADVVPAALDLLWHAFRDQALEPRWLTATALEAWVQEPGGLPRQIDRIVPSGSAVHLEEPFGASAPTDVEQFITDLGDLARQTAVRDSRLIVTSTSGVFARLARPAFPGLVVELPDETGVDAVRDPAHDVPRWSPETLLAVLVVDLLADSEASAEDAEVLYDAVAGPGRHGRPDWDEVLARSGDVLVARGELRPFPLQLRRPRLREELMRHAESSDEAAELSRQVVARAAASGSLTVRLAALRALLRQPTLWRRRAWATPMLDAFLNSPDTLVRRQARFAVVESLPQMPADLRAAVLDDARQHWNDRFLLRLALHGELADDERAGLAARLAGSWDRWVRAVTAKNLHHLGADPAVLSVLLRDEDRQVAREGARALLAHQDAWTHAAASPTDLLPDELRRDPSIRPLLEKDSPADHR